LLVVAFIAGCGTSGGVSGPVPLGGSGGTPTVPVASAYASPPLPAPSPGSGGTPIGGPTLTSPETVTLADAGYTVRLSRGERLDVYLQDGAWDPPQAYGGAVQRTEAAGGYPSGEPARATFVAVANGTATILSRTDHPCLHAHPPCAMVQRLWLVRVIVGG
jgi:hypothetical protein